MEEADGDKGGEGNDKGDGDTDEPDARPNKLYIWIDCVKAVSELTRFDFERVYRMPVVEFFSYIAYYNFDGRRRERELQKINRKYARH